MLAHIADRPTLSRNSGLRLSRVQSGPEQPPFPTHAFSSGFHPIELMDGNRHPSPPRGSRHIAIFWEAIALTIAALLPIMNPFSTAPLFVSLTSRASAKT